MSSDRGGRVAAPALLVAALVVCSLAGCSGEPGGGEAVDRPAGVSSPTVSARTAPASSSTGPGGAPCTVDRCTLQEAGEQAGLEVGVALKLGDEARRKVQAREFDAASSEIEFLWSVIHPTPDVWDFTGADRVVAFAEEHDMDFMATHMVWDPPAIRDVLPEWVRAIDDPDELRIVLREHLSTIAERYGDDIDRLVVVNEPLRFDDLEPDNHYFQVLGPGYIEESFTMAAELFPNAELVLNQDSTEYFPGKAEGLVGIARDLLATDVPLDRVGLQGHLTLGEPDWALIERTMAELASLGVTVDLTEIDVPRYGVNPGLAPIDGQEQAMRAGRMVRTCLDQPACASVTFWGLDDGDTWLSRFIGPDTRPLLFDGKLQPKAMYRAVLQELVLGR